MLPVQRGQLGHRGQQGPKVQPDRLELPEPKAQLVLLAPQATREPLGRKVRPE